MNNSLVIARFSDNLFISLQVTFVLLIAIASDDAFLLHSAMPDKLDEDSFEEVRIVDF